MSDGKYWQERFRQLEQAQNDSSVKKVREIQEQFARAQAALEEKINAWYQRFAGNNGIFGRVGSFIAEHWSVIITIVNIVIAIIETLSGVFFGVLDLIGQVVGFFVDNWPVIAPIIMGIVGALAVLRIRLLNFKRH